MFSEILVSKALEIQKPGAAFGRFMYSGVFLANPLGEAPGHI